ncbi:MULTISPECIES: helix-turn-helix domain-containing protein [Mycobacteriaceae]|uniref:Putative transcriptional regulator, IclR family protein n=1 Tax=Mycobacterium novum TaxID=2492438 RepID=A0A7I7JHW9_9MYCO|nr:helix-turn-helix domain-containing protein [Mycobacterium novum]BBX11525.1 putative transcriptional regulator, IclR family protein [Mycobacterium novum]
MGGRDDEKRGGSPPTDRVVAVVGLLAAQSQPSSIASIASRLELNRATVTSILLALEQAGWAVRRADRSYTLGPGLIGVADTVRRLWPLSTESTHVIEQLAERAGCGAGLALVGPAELSFLTLVRGRGRIPAGVGVGVRLPLIAPVGATVVAHRDASAQQAWLESAHGVGRDVLDDVLAQVRGNGVVVFGLGGPGLAALDVLAEVVDLLDEHPRRAALRQRVFELLTGVNGNPYTATQLAAAEPLSVSYLAAPVFDNGEATYELQLGPLRRDVSAADRDRYIREIRATAQQLSS